MNRRNRLMATLRGEAVDRPAVCFYELNGLDQNPDNPDPFNIFNDPSWRPLIDLTREKSDRIVMRDVPFLHAPPDPVEERTTRETWIDAGGSRFTRTTIRAARDNAPGGRVLTSLVRRDRDVLTDWTVEHLLKDVDDFDAWIDLPAPEPVDPNAQITGEDARATRKSTGGDARATLRPDTAAVLDAEAVLGDSGIVLLDTPDPLCVVASLFAMADYTIVAMTEPERMHRALEKVSGWLLPRVEAIARALPGRLWRIYGPEYASPPYLPPALFEEYVVQYVTPMVEAIHRTGGFARIHSHGRLREILPFIAATGCDALDPIEPPPQGDVELREVRRDYGDRWALFGNLEIADIENLPTREFAMRVETALREGTSGSGRGFVLMPSACPYGRKLSTLAMRNYEEMIRIAAGE